MGMITVNKQGSEVMADNQPFDDMSFTSGKREFYPPTVKHPDWRLTVGTILSLLLMYIVLCLAYSIWKTVYCWGYSHANACATLDTIEPLIWVTIISLPIVMIGVWLLVRIFIHLRQSKAVFNRSNLTTDRFGDLIPADMFDRISKREIHISWSGIHLTQNGILEYIAERYKMANSLQHDIAQWQQYKSVNSLSLNNTSTVNTPMLEAEIANTLKAISSEEWLTWINKQPHVILAGATGKGKTVTAKPIIAPRISAGEQLMIIDPHADHWFGLDVIGGGENWSEIKTAIEQVTMEYQTRQQARETYRRINGKSMPVELFKRLTVVMDEGFLVSLHTNTAPRGQISAWDQFIEVLGSGARKINISVVMLSQTANVEDLGVSGPLRENFTRIAVDNRAIKLMIKNEESDAQRRQQLYDALIGMAYPAVTVVDTSVVLLDRTGLDQVPDPHVTPANNYPFVRSSQGINNGHSNGFHSDGRNGHSIIDRLRVLRMSGVTREEARDDLGLVFSNEDWTNAQ